MKESDLLFPKGFLWGTATSSHQIEGNSRNNQWWEFEQKPGKILNGDTSDMACDHWNKFREDFAFLPQISQNAYRMSIEWSRIFPEEGKPDGIAVKRYHEIFQELRRRGVTIFLTLLHFTVPLWWERQGGFKSKKRE